MQISRITTKYQATVPLDVRAALGLQAGDRIAWEIERGTVTVRKARPLDIAFVSAVAATLDEWDSAEDEEAWRDL